jgi:hypothetical protein
MRAAIDVQDVTRDGGGVDQVHDRMVVYLENVWSLSRSRFFPAIQPDCQAGLSSERARQSTSYANNCECP